MRLKSKSFKLTLSILVTLTTPVFSQSNQPANLGYHKEIARKIVQIALTDQWGHQKLKELCEIGPRLSGSENSMKAILWARKTMISMGLDRIELQPVMVPYWVRGETEEAFILNGKELNVASLGGSIGTPAEGITAEVLEVRSFEELKEKSEMAAGKIIFFNQPMDPGNVNTFAAYGKAVVQRSKGAIWAAEVGGVAAIVRSVTTKYDNVTHVGSMRYSDKIKQIPAVAIGLIDADYLSKSLEKDPKLKINLRLSCKTLPDVESYNVIGEIRGSEKPEEIIVVGGHFDSWDKGDGAHDDAAGCIQALETLYLVLKLGIKPKRTLRCVFFINEENGIRGGKEYGRIADASNDQIHIAAIESDRGGFIPRAFTVNSDSEIINYLNGWLPVLKLANIDMVKKGDGGVDISQIKSCNVLIGLLPDAQRYFDSHHSDNDVFEAVHPRELVLGSAAMTIMAYLISEEGIPDLSNFQ
jgi:hypothetical protein